MRVNHQPKDFLDVVILYGGTMIKQMPIGDFQWVNKTLEEIVEVANDSDEGFFCYG